ncbi:MAG: hypothetical protein U0835_18490 [Isosphaeraceae bacterium]
MENDPQELKNVAGDPAYAAVVEERAARWPAPGRAEGAGRAAEGGVRAASTPPRTRPPRRRPRRGRRRRPPREPGPIRSRRPGGNGGNGHSGVICSIGRVGADTPAARLAQSPTPVDRMGSSG